MFLNHFKMNSHPFQERPPVEWILNDNRISQSLARLDYFARQGTLALLIGPTGAGKSTLLRLFIHNLSKNRYRPVYLHFTGIPSSSLLRLIVTQLGEAPRRGKDHLFLQIEKSYALLDYNDLRSLQVPDDGRRSMFDEYGMVPGTERLERFVLWPTGVPNPGAMRQWGRRAVAFVGERHFDDPYLIQELFVSADASNREAVRSACFTSYPPLRRSTAGKIPP